MVELSAAAVADRLAGTRLAGAVPHRMDAGMDSVAWRVGEHVVRVPRRQEGADCLATELEWLPDLAGSLSERVSVSDVVVPGDERFPWPVAGYPILHGETADRRHPDGIVDAAIGARLGHLLRELHQLPVPPTGAPLDRWRKSDLAYRVRDVERRVWKAHRTGGLDTAAAARCTSAAADWGRATAAHTTGWVHGDLHPRHVIVDDDELTGVIDWGDLHCGDPAVDVSIAWTLLAGPARSALLDVVRPSTDTAARARLRALFYGVVFINYGREIDDAAYRRTGARCLEALDLT